MRRIFRAGRVAVDLDVLSIAPAGDSRRRPAER
jgi:hypothetical protein